jgi:hypothetical protein
MAQYFDVLPSGDIENDGWTLVAASATTVWEILGAFDDDCYVRCPAYRGGIEVRFPTDVSSLPAGAIIDSVTVFVRMKTNAGSGARGVTVNILSADNRSRYTTRTLYATSTPTTYEVGTYSKDPLGRAWDIHRLNKLRARFFSQNNFSDSIRVYSLYIRVNFHTSPSVTVTSPSGTVGTPSPTVEWTYTQTEGEPQKSAEYKVFTLTQASASTFNPDTAEPVYAAKVLGIANSYILPTSLNNNDYKIYVRATSEHGAVSSWSNKQFKVSAPSPGVPGDNNAGLSGVPGVGTPTVVPDNYTSSAAIRMTDTSNLLSVQQADFEIASDPLGYVKGESTTTLARDTTQAFGDGLASMKVTSGASGAASAVSTKVEVYPSQPMTVRSQVLAGTTSRTVTLSVKFYDETYTYLSGSDITTSGSDSTTTWTELVATGTGPATAKYAEVVISAASTVSTEAHYVDHVGLMYGANTAWSDGGHTSRNMLTSFLATGDDPASLTDSWVSANSATTLQRVTNASISNPTGYHGEKTNQMTAVAVSPSIAFRAAGTTFNSTTSGVNFTLNKPAGVVENDLMIAFVVSSEFGSITPPTGWTAVNTAAVDDGTTDIALWVLKRTAGASEPSSWTTGVVSATSTRRSASVVAYSGAANASQQFIAEAVRTETSDPLVHQTATVVNSDANAWRIAAFAASDNVTGMTMTANVTPPSTAPGITYVGKATAWSTTSDTLSYTINKPSGVQSGDLMIATVLMSGNVSTVNTPSGWTLVRKTTVGSGGPHDESQTMLVYRRTAGSSEPNSWSASHNDWGQPKITQCVAYRNVDTTGNPFIAETATTKRNASSIGTGSVTNTNSKAWRVSAFGAMTPFNDSWSGGDTSERADSSTNLSGYYDTTLAVYDSNGVVSTGSHSRTASVGDSFTTAVGWIGLLKPLSAPPASGANETERVDFQTGSANPWTDLGVYDSAGTVATGQHSVYGILSTGDSQASNSMASWIGLIRPAASVQGGTIATSPNASIDISNVDPDVLTLAGGKLTMMANFRGSAAGTPMLAAEFYRANQLIGTQSASGNAFDTASFTKSWAVFDIPEGTTRIKPVLSALDRATSDTVQFTRVALMLGALDDPTQEPQWRNGTARPEHSVWQKPIIQYQENDGTGYGDWSLLAGQKALPPAYDLNTGQMFYVDHTIIPLNSRRYRVSTLAYGLNGDFFSSGYGPASQEAIFESRTWWLKDIQDLSKNMQVSVKWKDQQVDTANMATAFQPIGADYPVVITEGFKGDSFSLEIHCEQAEFTALMKLLNSGRTLILQSDIDKMWWVRPVGNIQANILATGSRQERPRRYVTVNFAQVAPEE